MALNKEFWRQRRVFLTGHTGFKGGWLVEWLVKLNCAYSTYSLPDDVRDWEKLGAAIEQSRADIVIHMAAQAIVSEGYADPCKTFSTNVEGTTNLLDEIRRRELPVKAILVVTSDKCYLPMRQPAKVGFPLGGHDPYSASKACQEHAAHAFAKSYGMPIATARAGNVIGGGDWAPNRLIPDIVRAKQAGKQVVLRYPNAFRPWQHVLDCLHGYLMLLERLYDSPNEFAGAYNFGPSLNEMPHSVLDIVKLWGCEYELENMDKKLWTKENPVLLLDSTRTTERIGWSPKLSTAEALEWTRAAYFDKEASRAKQIEKFESMSMRAQS